MPAYNSISPPFAIYRGDTYNILNAEQLGGSSSKASQQVCVADTDAAFPRPVTVTFTYASAPASVQYDIYVAWDDILTSYTKVGSTTNVNGDQVTLQRAAAGGPNFKFLLVKEVVSPGVNATVGARQ